MPKEIFAAYPSGHPLISEAMEGVVDLAGSSKVTLKPWRAMQIIGLKVDDEVRSNVAGADLLAADITYPNPNVFYEIGFAMAIGKPVVTTVHKGVRKATQRVLQTGLFDMLGWASYTNSEELLEALKTPPDNQWANVHIRPKNHSQPLFILDTQIKTDFRNHIFSAVANSALQYRVFDPAEIPRLTISGAIAEVSSSAGVSDELEDAERHNLRASFVLGLCHGYEVKRVSYSIQRKPCRSRLPRFRH